MRLRALHRVDLCALALAAALGLPVADAAEVASSPLIADHADARTEGSLAWHIAQSLAPTPAGTQLALREGHVYALNSDLTIPRNVTLDVPRGTVIEIADGATLTINGSVEAGPWRIFQGSGKVSGTPEMDYVRPQWWGTNEAALSAALAFPNVYLGTGQFVIKETIEIGDNTNIRGEPGCEIRSLMKGNPHSYFGMLGTSRTERVRNISIQGVKFTNTTAVGMYALAINQGGGENIRFTNCESEGCGVVFASNVRNIAVRDNTCHSSTLDKLDIFDDHHDGIYLSGVAEDCIIINNQIIDRRCHGIAVVAEAVFPPTSNNPLDEMKGKRILISGNTVVSHTAGQTAGGIWVSRVQDCRILGNHVEGYGDVGIDFEGSRNCVADSNVLVNNNKGLALYGNCRNITFSNNTVHITLDDVAMTAFFNSYSNGYEDIIDRQNTDILVLGNVFSNTGMAFDPTHGTGRIVTGTAERLVFRNNIFTNCMFASHFCDDLESIEIADNTFFNDYARSGYAVLHLAVSERDKTARTPPRNFIVRGNRFTSVNDETADSIIAIDTVGSLPDTAPFCDLNVVIEGNTIERETTSQAAITLKDSYNHAHHESMRVSAVVRGNVTNSPIRVDGLKQSTKAVTLVVEDNVRM